MKQRMYFFVILLLLTLQMQAQEDSAEYEQEKEVINHHSITLGISHSHVSEGRKSGDTKWLILPSWFIDYNYSINEEWAIGLHTDMIVETFEVEAKDGDSNINESGGLERNRPIAFVGAVSYEALPWLALVAGGGMEYEENESFGLIRLGLEPKVEITERWEIVGNLSYDIKFEAYNTWSIGIGVERKF